jgi:hypothetical protein
MLLETEASEVQQLFVPPTLSLPSNVTIFLISSTEVALEGSGEGWLAEGSTLQLKPTHSQTLPVWFDFKFSMAPGNSGVSLLGLQIFRPDHADCTIYLPASDGEVHVNLLNNHRSSETVRYTLAVGLEIDGTAAWIDDPTIAFDPQAGTS